MELEVREWVGKSGPSEEEFRKAVHIILNAVAGSSDLKPNMILKGGLLMGIRYKSSRFTKDVDFSTPSLFQDFNKDKFFKELNDALVMSSEELAYGIDCKVQSIKVQPKPKEGVELTFPSLLVSVGYANKGSNSHKRLLKNESPSVIKIDYSFNEAVPCPEELVLEGGGIVAYGFTDLIAEKIRSTIQQIVRNRKRRQDIYDLNYLLSIVNDIDDEEKLLILKSILIKSKGRLDPGFVNKDTLANEEIYSLSKEDYELLKDEVDDDLPEFDLAYEKVKLFYESLPWDYI